LRDWDINEKELEISEFYARYFARQEGRTRTDYEMDEDNYSLGKHMGMGLQEDEKHRAKLFGFGVLLVVLGFLGRLSAQSPAGCRVRRFRVAPRSASRLRLASLSSK
jgi:hypothetical protein